MPKNILAIDTSTPAQVIALATPGTTSQQQIIEDVSFPEKMNHSATLIPNIHALLQEKSLSPKDLDLVLVTLGPGSFTGLRIGLSVAKSIARAAKADLVGVSTLTLFAKTALDIAHPPQNPSKFKHIEVVIDARRRELFYAIYSPNLELKDNPQTRKPKAVINSLTASQSPVLLCGNAHTIYPEFLSLHDTTPSIYIPVSHPDPKSFIQHGLQKWQNQGPANLHTLEPDYIRASDAKKSQRPLPTQILWTTTNKASLLKGESPKLPPDPT